MTNSNRYCLHTRYDVHKHTGEHNMCWIWRST